MSTYNIVYYYASKQYVPKQFKLSSIFTEADQNTRGAKRGRKDWWAVALAVVAVHMNPLFAIFSYGVHEEWVAR